MSQLHIAFPSAIYTGSHESCQLFPSETMRPIFQATAPDALQVISVTPQANPLSVAGVSLNCSLALI